MNKDEKLIDGICRTRIEEVPVARLKPHKGNARKHPRAQIAKIAESIKTFGWLTPILIDHDHTIIAGHGRVMAAKLLGLMSVPAIRVEHLSQGQVRAYMLADNRLAELAEWDKDTLEKELAELKSLDLDFDLEITGFDLDQLDVSFDANDQDQGKDRAQAAAPGQAKRQCAKKNATIGKNPPRDEDFRPVSRPGDRWVLELSDQQVDTTIQRWQELTGQDARLEQTGQTFAEVSKERASEVDAANPLAGPITAQLIAN